jgi:hypothetical protein
MKKLLILLTLGALWSGMAQAGSIGTTKIYTGNKGGVVTLQKRVSSMPNGRSWANGLLTVSDVAFAVIRDTDNVENNDQTLGEVDDAVTDEQGVRRARITGRVQFKDEAVPDEGKKLTLNGYFRVFHGVFGAIHLKNIMVSVIDGEPQLSGIVVVGGAEYEINEAPEAVQKFVRRLIVVFRRA